MYQGVKHGYASGDLTFTANKWQVNGKRVSFTLPAKDSHHRKTTRIPTSTQLVTLETELLVTMQQKEPVTSCTQKATFMSVSKMLLCFLQMLTILFAFDTMAASGSMIQTTNTLPSHLAVQMCWWQQPTMVRIRCKT